MMETPEAPPRVIHLEGGHNFREVGGYQGLDGRPMRRGLLWRSAQLDELTEDDVRTLEKLGIATIVDLRRPSERARHPSHPDIARGGRRLAWDARRSPDRPLQELFPPNLSSADYRQRVSALYAALPSAHVSEFQGYFEALATETLPLLVHCAAGKDRTGIAVGLLLATLGVSRQDILADYAATTRYLDRTRVAAALAAASSSADIAALPPAALSSLIDANPEYLAHALDQIEQSFGSVEGFVQLELGLNSESLQIIRQRLLEPPPP